MNKVLITKGLHSFSHRVAKLFTTEEILFADSDPIPEWFIKSKRYIQVPAYNAPSFCHALLAKALDHDVVKLLPLLKDEIVALRNAKPLFDEYGIQLLLPDNALSDDVRWLENPPQSVPLTIVNDGLCCVSDAGEDLIWCCIS